LLNGVEKINFKFLLDYDTELMMIFFFVLFLTFNIFFVISHEQTHVQINKYYGVESEIELNFFGLLGGRTVIKQGETFSSKEDKKTAYLLHSFIEVQDYHLLPIMNTIIVFIVVGSLFIKFDFVNLNNTNKLMNMKKIKRLRLKNEKDVLTKREGV